MEFSIKLQITCAAPEGGGGGGGGESRPSMENHKNIGVLAILVRIP